MIKSAGNSPFILIKDSEITVHDFEVHLPMKVDIPNTVLISDAVKIDYFLYGPINVFKSYTNHGLLCNLTTDLEFDDLLKTPPALPIGITKAKISDVKALLKYLSAEGQLFFNHLFETSCVKAPKPIGNNSMKSSEKKKSVKCKKSNEKCPREISKEEKLIKSKPKKSNKKDSAESLKKNW